MKKLFSKMNKTLRKVLLGVLIAAVACGAIWGGMTLIRNARRGAVKVYPITDFCMTDYWGDSSETYGMVTTDRLQKVYISSTQTVREVFVTEGQEVKKGDKLLSYDTTLTDLDVKRAQIALEKQELAVKDLKDQLQRLKDGKLRGELEEEQQLLQAQLNEAIAKAENREPGDPLPLPEGEGTSENPFYVLWKDGTELTPTALHDMLGDRDDAYVLFVTPDEDSRYYYPYHGIHITALNPEPEVDDPTPDAEEPQEPQEPQEPTPEPAIPAVSVTFEDGLSLPEAAEPQYDKEIKELQDKLQDIQLLLDDPNTPETPLDKQKLINDKIGEIRDADLALQIATVDLKKLKAEVQDGAVYSELDGTVKAVRDATEAYTENTAVVEVSGGGGYYVTGSVSELELDTVKVGQTASISSWMTGASCEGEVVEIGTDPTTENGWSNGNNNVSWYPLKIFVSDDADLQEGDYVNITYQADTGSSGSWWLESMFIRTENGKSYVLVRGENGTLEQRWVQTGRDLWGSYTEIRGGLTPDEFVAFPYGQDVVPGVKTVESSAQEFYNYY